MTVRNTRGPVAAAAALVLILLLPGCWVRTDSKPKNVDAVFAEAIDQAMAIQAVPAETRGRPRKVRVLVYDSGDDQLVDVSLPLWLVRRLAGNAAREGGRESAGMARYGLTFERILRGGRGVLVQAEEEDERVLVWLD